MSNIEIITKDDTQDSELQARIEQMTPEQREQLLVDLLCDFYSVPSYVQE